MLHLVMVAGTYVITMVAWRPSTKHACFIFVGLVVLMTLYVLVTCGVDQSGRDLFKKHGLLEVYDELNGYTADTSAYNKKQVTYGEITGDGIQALAKIAKAHELTTFVDMGCGVGRSLILARLCGFKECVGVELVEDRYKQATDAFRKLPPDIQSDIKIVQGDMMTFNLSRAHPIFVFASNLLWGKELTQRFLNKVRNECPGGSVVALSVYEESHTEGGFQLMSKTKVPMSWESNSYVNIFRVI